MVVNMPFMLLVTQFITKPFEYVGGHLCIVDLQMQDTCEMQLQPTSAEAVLPGSKERRQRRKHGLVASMLNHFCCSQ